MYPAIFSRTYPMKSIEAVLATIRADGFAGAQMNLSSFGLDSLPESLPEGSIEEGRAVAAKLGIKLAALSGTYNMALAERTARLAMRPRFRNVAIAARRMGAPVVTLCTGSRSPESMWTDHPENSSQAAWHDLTDELAFALDVAEEFSLSLGIEPEPGNVICDAKAARRMLDQLKSPRLKIILDAANIVPLAQLERQNEIVDEALDLLAGDIVLAHAKDMTAKGEVVAPGKGAIDLERFVQKLEAARFTGALIGHGFDASASAEAGRELRRLCGYKP